MSKLIGHLLFLVTLISVFLVARYDPIVGTENNDVLLGTAQDDSIRGLGGNDQILGQAGNDWIEGGGGDDVIDGGPGDDLMLWRLGDGVDVVTGGSGNDTLVVDAGGKIVDDDGSTIRIDGQIAIGAYANVVTRFDNAFVPPVVSVESPSDGTVLEVGQAIAIEINAVDPDGTVEAVEIYWGDALITTITEPPYTFVRNSVMPGCYEIYARAVDDNGFAGLSSRTSFQIGDTCGQAPYLGEPIVLPGVLEVEYYDLGGEGTAYSDQDEVNSGNEFGNTFRTEEGVDLEPSLDVDGGFNIGWIYANEWVQYTVDVAQSGRYQMEARVASSLFGGLFSLEVVGGQTYGPVPVQPTGGWQEWESVMLDDIELEAGIQTWRIHMITNGININKLIISESTSTTSIGVPAVPGPVTLDSNYPNPFKNETSIRYSLLVPGLTTLQVFDLQGRLIETLIEEVQTLGTYTARWNPDRLPAGTYVVQLKSGQTRLSKTVQHIH